ncbi:MAG: neutral zinc metallopeptidase [Candidatus Competibacteraceae bacterium]|nr:neutral zinc metallopeptidase [Candidatus Competibacteraceae bacterium]
MRWRGGRRSSNVEDRRGRRVSGRKAGGGIGVIIIVLIAMYFGVDPNLILNLTGQTSSSVSPQPQRQASPEEQQQVEFVSVVLGDTEDTWHALFQQLGRTYQEPTLVLFSDAVESACGFAQSAVGPFYCGADQKVYIDLSFFRDLETRFQAPGDFAQAYVIAHEVGHHVQNLLGISQKVQSARSRASETQGNQLSVRQELQADCFAGVWAHHADKARQILERGDIEEALNAASSIGDDRLQRQARGHVTPDSFTHGSSAQRVRWFKRGIESGQLNQCDTFGAKQI